MCPQKVENPPILGLIGQAVKVMQKKFLKPCLYLNIID